LVNEPWRPSVFHRPTGFEAAAPESIEIEAPLMRLRPLQGATRRGPPNIQPSIASSTHSAIRGSRSREARPGGRCRQLSWSLLPLRRLSPSESTPPRFAKAGYVPSSGFRTLSTAFSSLGRPALFHAGNVDWVRPSWSSANFQVPPIFASGLPSWRCSSARTVSHINVS
jgi:hypothetical protein